MLSALSGCDWGQADGGSIAQGCDGFQRHVAGALYGPFVVLLEEQGAYEADEGGLVREDPDDIAATLDFTVEAFERVRALQFGAVLGWAGLGWEVHVGENLGFGIVHQGGEPWHAWAGLIGDLAPLLARGFGIVLGEGGTDPGSDDAPLGLAGIGQRVAHEMNPEAVA